MDVEILAYFIIVHYNNLWSYSPALAQWRFLSGNATYSDSFSVGKGVESSMNLSAARSTHSISASSRSPILIMFGGANSGGKY